MIQMSRVDPSNINRCQACPSLGKFLIVMKKKRFGTGSLEKPVVSTLILCEECASSLREELPSKAKELTEIQYQNDYK